MGRVLIYDDGDRYGLIRMAVSMTEPLYRLLFKPSHWNAVIRNALQTAGADWIWLALPRRFTDADFDRDELGYDADGEYQSPIARALNNGLMDRLAGRYWQGWNPWRSPKVPAGLWRDEVKYEKDHGRMPAKPSKSWFKTLKKALRQRVKSDLKRRVEELSESGESNAKQPLVNSGELRDVALSNSRATAVATSNKWGLRIIIPQPHPTHPVVGRTLRQVTPDELRRMALVVNDTIHATVADSNPAPRGQRQRERLAITHHGDDAQISVGPAKRLPERELSTSQLATFANEHRSRKLRHRSRSLAA